MGQITLNSVTFSSVPSANQVVQISWRRQSDPDIPASYTNKPNAIVNTSGNIISPNPYIINVPDDIIVVKAINQCGGAGATHVFTICTMVTIIQSGIVGSCPSGYTLSQDGSYCYQILTQPPIITQVGYCVAPATLDVWNDSGTRVYKAGHNVAIDWTTPAAQYTPLTSVPQWQSTGNNPPVGIINRYAVWIDSDCDGDVDPLTAGQQVTLAAIVNNTGSSRAVYVGVSGDNQFELKVNNVLVAQTANGAGAGFKIFHIFPVELMNGTNYFNIIGTGDGSVGDHVSMVIFDNTEAQILAASNDSQLNILWHSHQIIGQQIEVATCPSGYNLDTSGGVGNYICKQIITTPPI